ncbi:aminodeoxychorismate/anthranilate synthase component II [bacterium]|nr:aminodeoxychorismate/anthranilate synthase component II [bacterium]
MILMIDNYDSFTYNLVQYFYELGAEVKVIRNDDLSLADITALTPSKIVISPGPGRPEDAGISEDIIRHLGPSIPTLGVCLGHQAIGRVFGGTIIHAPTLVHGKTSPIFHEGTGVFNGLPNPFNATRYHSLIVERNSLPACLNITATTSDGLIMGLRHEHLPIEGIQFHPESILTEYGRDMLRNFMETSWTV